MSLKVLLIAVVIGLSVGGLERQSNAALLTHQLLCGGYLAQTTKEFSHPGLLLVSLSGRTAYRQDSYSIQSVECVSLAGGKTPQLLVAAFTGGAHCCTTVQVFFLAPFRQLLSYDGNSFVAKVDVRHTAVGRTVLVLSDGHFDYFEGLCHACSPTSIPMVTCFSDGAFRDCTSQFPSIVVEWTSYYTKALKQAIVDQQSSAYPEAAEQTTRGMALGVYASYLLMNQESRGLAIVDDVVSSAQVHNWLVRHRGVIRTWFGARGHKLLKP